MWGRAGPGLRLDVQGSPIPGVPPGPAFHPGRRSARAGIPPGPAARIENRKGPAFDDEKEARPHRKGARARAIVSES
jgi:hypothetical protein